MLPREPISPPDRSEVRLVGDRNMPIEMLIVFGARFLDHFMLDTPITARSGPGRMEGIRIVHREDDLDEPAVLDYPPALDDMELVGVRRAVKIEECVGVLRNRVDDERVALVMSDRFSVPRRLRIFQMGNVEIDPADLLIALVDHPHHFRRLHEVNGLVTAAIGHKTGNSRGQTARSCREGGFSGEDFVIVFLHPLLDPRLQVRIGDIADSKGRLPAPAVRHVRVRWIVRHRGYRAGHGGKVRTISLGRRPSHPVLE